MLSGSKPFSALYLACKKQDVNKCCIATNTPITDTTVRSSTVTVAAATVAATADTFASTAIATILPYYHHHHHQHHDYYYNY